MTADAETIPITRDALTTLLNQATTKWLSVQQAAEHAALSVRSIRQLLSAGKLTAFRPVRGKIVISREQLDNLIASSTAKPRTGRGLS